MFNPSCDTPPAHGHPLWPDSPTPELLLEVDFKWLMAGQGRWIDPQRLHTDPDYAHDCLENATHSPCAALRHCAHDLQELMGPAAH